MKIKCVLNLLQCFYYKLNCSRFDSSFFKGKKIAIIGGADSALIDKEGKYIDTFDVVVRINKGVELIELQKEYIGSKTTFLYHSFFDTGNEKFGSPITINLWKKENVENIIYCFPPFEESFIWQFILFNKKNKSSIPVSYISKKKYLKIKKILRGSVPTAGFVALKTIIDSDPQEVFIKGFTFFKTQMNSQYRALSDDEFKFIIENTHHNHDLEFEYIKKIYVNKSINLKIDSKLKELFDIQQ